jgi:hypothetical protein
VLRYRLAGVVLALLPMIGCRWSAIPVPDAAVAADAGADSSANDLATADGAAPVEVPPSIDAAPVAADAGDDLGATGPDACPEVAVAVPFGDGPHPPPPDAGPPARCQRACPLDCLNALTSGCAPAGSVVGGSGNPHVQTVIYANGVKVENGGPFSVATSPSTPHFGIRVFKDERLCYQIWVSDFSNSPDLSYRDASGREVAMGRGAPDGRVSARCDDQLADITDTACPLDDGPVNCAPGPPPPPSWCGH